MKQIFLFEFYEFIQSIFLLNTSKWLLLPWSLVTFTWITDLNILEISQAYSEHCQISEMELFADIVNGIKPFTILAKSFVLDVSQSSEHASEP